jgi:hypothetical protein
MNISDKFVISIFHTIKFSYSPSINKGEKKFKEKKLRYSFMSIRGIKKIQ